MKKFALIAATALMTVTAPTLATANEITREIAIDEGFTSFDSGYPTTLATTWMTIIRGPDFYEFCGAITYVNNQGKRLVSSSRNNSKLLDGKTTVLKGFNYFAVLPTRSKGIGEMATCKATTVPSSKRDADWDIDWAARKGRL